MDKFDFERDLNVIVYISKPSIWSKKWHVYEVIRSRAEFEEQFTERKRTWIGTFPNQEWAHKFITLMRTSRRGI